MLLALLIVIPAMRDVHGPEEGAVVVHAEAVRIGLAVIVASGAVVIALAAESRGVIQWLVPIIAAAIALAALRPLPPAGTSLARRGLPSVMLMRALVAATFFAAEIYVPVLLVAKYGTSAAVAGLALTVAALSWSATSWVPGRLPSISHVLVARARHRVLDDSESGLQQLRADHYGSDRIRRRRHRDRVLCLGRFRVASRIARR